MIGRHQADRIPRSLHQSGGADRRSAAGGEVRHPGRGSRQVGGRHRRREAGLLDLPNICFMGTNVVSGTARAVVVATGSDTYFGSLARNVVSHKRIETSFDRGVNSVTKLLIRFMLVMVPIVFMLSGVSSGDWMSALTFALAVAVGLTPRCCR